MGSLGLQRVRHNLVTKPQPNKTFYAIKCLDQACQCSKIPSLHLVMGHQVTLTATLSSKEFDLTTGSSPSPQPQLLQLSVYLH